MMKALQPIIVKTTAAKKEDLQRIAAILIERNLAACVNIGGPIDSVYHWEGKIEHSEEWTAEIKTDQSLAEEVAVAIKNNHPYEVPPVLAIPVEILCPEFGQWMRENLKNDLEVS